MIRVIDTETTGLEADCSIVQIGWTNLHEIEDCEGVWEVGRTAQAYVDDGVIIPPEASAIHHITKKTLTDSGALPLLPTLSKFCVLDPEIETFAAFNVAFDSQFVTIPQESRWICLYKCAVRLAPYSKKWSNQYLRYAMQLTLDETLATPPHHAGPDSYVSAHILARMLKKHSVDDLVDISARPIIFPHLQFGKHAGVPCENIPPDYWDWMLRQPRKASGDPEGFDENIVATALHFRAQTYKGDQS